MDSKKEEFTNTIQFLIGQRIENLEAKSYNTVKELATLLQTENDKKNWKPLHFLSIFYKIKEKIEQLTSNKVKSTTNINQLLNKTQKEELSKYLIESNIKTTELMRPSTLNTIVFLFPVPAIMGTMLICTYFITKHDYSGWIYLSGLVGIALSLTLFLVTAPLRTHFKEDYLVDYAKLTYTIKQKDYCKIPNTTVQLIQFITDELEVVFGQRFSETESIPEN